MAEQNVEQGVALAGLRASILMALDRLRYLRRATDAPAPAPEMVDRLIAEAIRDAVEGMSEHDIKALMVGDAAFNLDVPAYRAALLAALEEKK